MDMQISPIKLQLGFVFIYKDIEINFPQEQKKIY